MSTYELCIDVIKEWVLSLGYATKAWVLGKAYATITYLELVKAQLLQWVADQNYLQTSYVHRGDTSAWDFDIDDIICNSQWHNMDLSSIIPPNSVAVDMVVIVNSGTVAKRISFRKKGQVFVYNQSYCKVLVANITNYYNTTVVVLGENRIIEYSATPGLTDFRLVVKGWWL